MSVQTLSFNLFKAKIKKVKKSFDKFLIMNIIVSLQKKNIFN